MRTPRTGTYEAAPEPQDIEIQDAPTQAVDAHGNEKDHQAGQECGPIYHLFKTNVPFNWGDEQKEAMAILQEALTTAPALVSICYDEGAGEIILAPGATLLGWGGVLMQLDKEGRRHPARYESGLWSEAEKKYNAGKRECRGLLKTAEESAPVPVWCAICG